MCIFFLNEFKQFNGQSTSDKLFYIEKKVDGKILDFSHNSYRYDYTKIYGEIKIKFKSFYSTLSLFTTNIEVVISLSSSSSSCHVTGTNIPNPLTTHLYRPLLPVGLQGYILYRNRVVVHGSSWWFCLCSSL